MSSYRPHVCMYRGVSLLTAIGMHQHVPYDVCLLIRQRDVVAIEFKELRVVLSNQRFTAGRIPEPGSKGKPVWASQLTQCLSLQWPPDFAHLYSQPALGE